MDSLNNSLYELDNIPIEYAPKLKTKNELLKPSHFFLCEDAHHIGENEETEFNLESQEKEENQDGLSLDEKLSEKTEFSDNLNSNSLSDLLKENDDSNNTSSSFDYDKFCILGFLRRKSN